MRKKKKDKGIQFKQYIFDEWTYMGDSRNLIRGYEVMMMGDNEYIDDNFFYKLVRKHTSYSA